MNVSAVSGLSAQDLVARVRSLNADGNRVLASLLLHLGEMEVRELYTKHACSSMFAFCRRLGMSEGSAGRRLTSARAVRRFPQLLPLIERGELHLTALSIVSGILTVENVDAVAAAVRGKTQCEVEEIRVRYAPRPVVKDSIRKPAVMGTPAPAPAPAAIAMPQPPAVIDLPLLPPHPSVNAPTIRIARPAPAVVPLQEDAYKVQLTASKALVAKIDHVREMMRHRNPKGDLATILDAALDLLVAKLEKERFGKTSRPRKVAKPRKEGTISRETRRVVFERDGHQCTHVDAEGHRCEERGWLELDHVDPKALDGSDDPSNLRVRCRAHNMMHAKDTFGAVYIDRRIQSAKKERATKVGRAKSEAGGAQATTRPSHSTGGGESAGRLALSRERG